MASSATPVRRPAASPRRTPARRPGTTPRLVRHVPFTRRVLSAPQDWWMSIEEAFHTVDWDAVQANASVPITAACNVLMVLAKLRYLSEQGSEVGPIINSPQNTRTSVRWDVGDPEPSWFADTSLLMAGAEWFLIFLSIANACWVFTRYKMYQLIHFLDELYETRPRLSPNMRTLRIDETRMLQQPRSIWRRMWMFGKKTLWPQKEPEESNGRLIVELHTWSPSALGLNFFCWFSPPQALLMHFIESDNWVPLMAITFMMGFSLHYLATTFHDLLRDQQILLGQVQKEYDLSLVSRRIFNNCVHKSVQTDPLAEFDYEEERTQPESQSSHGRHTRVARDIDDSLLNMSWTSASSRHSPFLYFDDAGRGNSAGDAAAQSSHLDDEFSTLRPLRRQAPPEASAPVLGISSPPASNAPSGQRAGTPRHEDCHVGHTSSFAVPGRRGSGQGVLSSPVVPEFASSTPRAPTSAVRSSFPAALPPPDSWKSPVLR